MDVISFILQGSVEEYWNSVLPGPCRATLGMFHGAGVALGRECGDKVGVGAECREVQFRVWNRT